MRRLIWIAAGFLLGAPHGTAAPAGCSEAQLASFVARAQSLDKAATADGARLSRCPGQKDVAIQWQAFLLMMTGDAAGSRSLDDVPPRGIGSSRDSVLARARGGQFRDLLLKIDGHEAGYVRSAEAQLVLARVLTRKGEFRRGRDAYRAYLRLVPGDAEAEAEYVYSFLWEGDGREADAQIAAAAQWSGQAAFAPALARAKALRASGRSPPAAGGLAAVTVTPPATAKAAASPHKAAGAPVARPSPGAPAVASSKPPTRVSSAVSSRSAKSPARVSSATPHASPKAPAAVGSAAASASAKPPVKTSASATPPSPPVKPSAAPSPVSSASPPAASGSSSPAVGQAAAGEYLGSFTLARLTDVYRRRTAAVDYRGAFDVRLAAHTIQEDALEHALSHATEASAGGTLQTAEGLAATAHVGYFSAGDDHWTGDAEAGYVRRSGLKFAAGAYRRPLGLQLPLTSDALGLMRDGVYSAFAYGRYVELRLELQKEGHHAAHEAHAALGRLPLYLGADPDDSVWLRLPAAVEAHPRPSPDYDSAARYQSVGAGLEVSRRWHRRWRLVALADYALAAVTDRATPAKTRQVGEVSAALDASFELSQSLRCVLSGRYFRADEMQAELARDRLNSVTLGVAYGVPASL